MGGRWRLLARKISRPCTDNFQTTPFLVAGLEYQSVEQEYQAMKFLTSKNKNEVLAKYLDDSDDRQRIREGKTVKIPCEQQAEAEAVQVAITPAAEPYAADSYDMDVKYCTLLKKSCK
jgi:predicted NAD-dependent protein-ADP-ribosyltransferase YbiA (DUF1768 family)